MTADFIIVGGGVGGAVLAGLLGRNDKKVLVLERNLTAPNWVRPEILWPRSMDVLFSLSPRQRWLDRAALPLREIEFHDGRRVVSFFRESVLREPRVQPWSTDPNQTREHLLNLGTFEVRRGVEVISVLKEGGRVVGVRTRDVSTRQEADIVGRCTVGDDGAQSLVRKACGIELATREFPIEFVCFDGDRPAAIPPGHARVWWNPRALDTGIVGLMMMPLPNNRFAALVPVVSKTFAANAAVDACWERFCQSEAGIRTVLAGRRFPHDMVRVNRSWGHAVRYGADGVVLIGDAVHPVSPAGGQGANMSIADAVALAELVLSQTNNLLAEYERLRRPANARSIRPTRIAEWIWSAPPWLSPVPLVPFMVHAIGQCPRLQHRFMRSNARSFQGSAA
ncbi:MAG TPA: NAD(P)/FAD-dependent oxidoreductase [Nitrospiraceae bacterium]|nr:NAD(P)/FAD-dependent oxidoreductase [Nitrospiraceae bacterium]